MLPTETRPARPATHGRLLVCLCDTCPNDSAAEHHGFCASCAVMGCRPRASRCAPLNLVTEAMAKSRVKVPRAPKYKAESSPPATLPRGRVLKSSSDAYLELADIKDADREHFVAFFLNARHRVIARHIVSIGSAVGCDAHPREVFKPALMAGATAIILAHNHPSGEPSPSRTDIELTQRLREVGELVGIAILDHIVVASGGFTSLAERGWK